MLRNSNFKNKWIKELYFFSIYNENNKHPLLVCFFICPTFNGVLKVKNYKKNKAQKKKLTNQLAVSFGIVTI